MTNNAAIVWLVEDSNKTTFLEIKVFRLKDELIHINQLLSTRDVFQCRYTSTMLRFYSCTALLLNINIIDGVSQFNKRLSTMHVPVYATDHFG